MNQDLFPTRLKDLRSEKNLTLEELAKAIGTTKTTLSRYENAERSPKLEIVGELANYFSVDMAWLSGLTDTKHAKNIIPILNQLEEKRQDTVYDFAMSQLKEQLSDLKKAQDKKESNVVSYPNKTEIDTIAAHRVDETAIASPEDKSKLHSKLDEMDRKFDEQQKRIKAAEDAKRGGSDE